MLKKYGYSLLLLGVFVGGGIPQASALVGMNDEALASVSGQALFFSDKIGPNALTGAGGAGSPTDFTFYRMGLNVDMAFNLNIDKLQLGCGGSNEILVANACDIDMNYVRFMGRSGTAPGAAVTSGFTLRRPYIELVVKEDGNKVNREVIGVKIGFESADGALSIGREYKDGGPANALGNYPAGETNVEHGGACTAESDGNGALACHSGITRMSGFLNMQLSGRVDVKSTLGTSNLCFGDTTGMGSGGAALHANCDGSTSNNTGADASFRDPFFIKRSGTRMSKLLVLSKRSTHPDNFPAMIYAGALSPDDSAHVDMRETLRFVHNIVLDNTKTKDFFLSFQREQVAYPKYDKSGYAATANTGWWMNIPYAEARNLQANHDLGALASTEVLFTLQEGVNIVDLNLKQQAVSNCYGSLKFC